MEIHILSHVEAIIGILVFFFLFFLIRKAKTWKNSKKFGPPPPQLPGAWPIIGHLPQILSGTLDGRNRSNTDGEIRLAHTLAALADKYGPIFTFRQGMFPIVVVNNKEEEKEEAECFRKAFKQTMYYIAIVGIEDAFPIPLLQWLDLQGNIKTIVSDATHTTAVHLIWIIACLLNNKHVLEKVHEEIDTKVGKDCWVEDSDIKNLTYFQATIKEVLRLYPPSPMLLHEALADCQVLGYHITKGTRLFVNVWKLQKDPKFWPEPEKFLPERFLTTKAKVDVYGKDLEFIPFGSGRRSCPGITMAMQVTYLSIARLLQAFDFETPNNESVDMTEGLGFTAVKKIPLEVVVKPQVESSIKELYTLFVANEAKNVPTKVDIGHWFDDMMLNITVKMIGGRRYSQVNNKEEEKEEAECFRKAFKQTMYYIAIVGIEDAFPIPLLQWLDLQGNIKTIVSDATHTTAVHLIWIIACLLNNKHVLEKVHEEIDTKVGKDCWVEDSDIKNLTYFQATIKEVLRLYPPSPMLLHEALADCQVLGYHITKGTRLFVNVWKLQKDPKFWPEPEKFLPERFLTTKAKVDVYGKDLEFIPFGSGRRSCPGITMAMQVTYLSIARLLQAFDFETPNNESVDMTEGLGFTAVKKIPLEVVVKPRMLPMYYGV
ncbi:hypothetical protein RDI58_016446 [Solanum bulbocastanum]|uniref:Cytochrome P450 n=1 Tax=Solanum bulbocastanum TaxID=147425 RepID=A0AAN8TLZ0_SOLBU